MGIKELTKFIEPCGILVSYDEYAGQYVVVDAFQKIYKYCIKSDWDTDKTSPSDTILFNRHLRSVINCINQLLKFDIVPIFVFDGSSIAMKAKNKVKKHDVEPSHEIKKKKIFKITPQQIKECERLISSIGLPCVRAPFEADSQCAAMTMGCSDIKTVITDDTDTLTFGSRAIVRMLPMKMINVLRELFWRFVHSKCTLRETCNDLQDYSIEDIANILGDCDTLKQLQNRLDIKKKYSYDKIIKFSDRLNINFAIKYETNIVLEYLMEKANVIRRENNITETKILTHKNFMDMCILFGTDYLHRIPSMTADDIFRTFVIADFDIERFINLNKSKTIPENYIKLIDDVKDYYTNASVIDPNTIDLSVYKPIDQDIYALLSTYGFTMSHINSSMKLYNSKFSNLLRKYKSE